MNCKKLYDFQESEFEDVLKTWIQSSLKESIPPKVKALCFNLFEPSSREFGVELIGSSYFDPNDEDWACNEIWESNPRKLIIPYQFSSHEWRYCQDKLKNIISNYMKKKLNEVGYNNIVAVAIGFVDGDLDFIYKK